MKVSKTEEHGLRLAMTLAKEGRQMTISSLAEREKLSEALIAKLLGMLRKGVVVRAELGRKGGYELAASPQEISVAKVVRSLGPALFRGCLEVGVKKPSAVDCAHVEDCGLRPVWAIIEEKITHMAGARTAEVFPAEEMRRYILEAGREPVERDTLYNVVGEEGA